MLEHIINSTLCSCIFLISMEIIFKSANVCFTNYEVALLILKTSHIVRSLVLRVSNAISYLVRYTFALLIKDLI